MSSAMTASQRSAGVGQTFEIIEAISRKSGAVNLVAAASEMSSYVRECMRRFEFPHVAEGYIGNRCHEGGGLLDALESLAIENTVRLFGQADINVQAWRCTNAIVATCFGLARPGEAILGLICASGEYYATGSTNAHFLSKCFRIETYDVDRTTHLLDYDSLEARVREVQPRILFAGDTSYSRHWDWAAVADIAARCDCIFVADISQTAGLIAAGLYPSPFAHADVVIFATYKTLRGPKGAVVATVNTDLAPRLRRSLYPGTQGSCCGSTVAGIAAAMEYAGTIDGKAWLVGFDRRYRHTLVRRQCAS
jgi:glycine hydroxymethyltransferase